MTETHIPLSAYQTNKFVYRKEIEQVISMLRQPQPGPRAIIFEGDRGAGKTWLSLHFQRVIFKNEMEGVISWLFSLCSPGENYHPWGDQLQENEYFVSEGEPLSIENFLEKIIESSKIEPPPNPALEEKVDAVNRYVQDHADHCFVLILDSAYESDWKLLEALETHFLGKLLTLSNFFVIVTGRGRPYPWKTPSLIEALRFRLGKFSFEEVQEQLRRFGLSPILSEEAIYKIGEGWPIFTEHLAQAKNQTNALDIAVEILFAIVPVRERQQVRRYFEALCPLEGFGETEVALMVENYEGKADQDGRAICRKMNETRLVSWKNGGYEMNEPVGKIVRQYLQLTNQEAWLRLHKTAYDHFAKQAQDASMERFRPFFEKQANAHSNILQKAGATDAQLFPEIGLSDAKNPASANEVTK